NYENTTFQKLNEDSLRKVLSNNKENLCVLEIDDMGLFLVGTGTSCSGINMLSNVGLSTTYRSLINKMNKIEKDHALSNIA
ncbi:1999_t:CDS:2, partial [Entrophospora sp. SA101]